MHLWLEFSISEKLKHVLLENDCTQNLFELRIFFFNYEIAHDFLNGGNHFFENTLQNKTLKSGAVDTGFEKGKKTLLKNWIFLLNNVLGVR